MLVLASYLTFASAALPKWTGWVAFLAAVLNFAFIPSMYFGTNPQEFYTASGRGPAVGATFPFRLWFLVTIIIMVMKRQPSSG